MVRRVFPDRSAQLEHKLASSQEAFASLEGEHQTSLVELLGAHRELHSVNEALQSVNEELETSKEQLHTVSEELNAVNARLSEQAEELDSANNDLRNLFASTEIATIFVDRQLVIRSFTPAIVSVYDLIPSDHGRPCADIATRLDYHELRADVAQVLATVQPLERRIARQDGSAHYAMRILPYREPDSTVTGALITFVDITGIVRAESTAREADLRKDAFLATLSHELRNPLAPIQAAARLLQLSGIQPSEMAKCRSIISRQVAHMSSLLDDLLDASRITRGASPLRKEHVHIEDVLNDAVEAVQPAIVAKGHVLRIQRPQDPLVIDVDPVRITQVVSNLLTNAVKYTPAGGEITLASRLDERAVIILVSDNGLGLAPEMLGEVFTMFTRVQSETSRTEGGLGIGLALAKGLVELHGGRIEARSAGLGKGSEFVVSLPRALVVNAVSEAPGQLRGSVPRTGRRVLIADDNDDAAETLQMFLQALGHEVYVADCGSEALDLASRMRPDVVILDIGMPDLSGYEVAKRIRHEAWGSQTTMIALTGWGQEQDRRTAIGAGFNHHLTKPVDPDKLDELITRTHSP